MIGYKRPPLSQRIMREVFDAQESQHALSAPEIAQTLNPPAMNQKEKVFYALNILVLSGRLVEIDVPKFFGETPEDVYVMTVQTYQTPDTGIAS